MKALYKAKAGYIKRIFKTKSQEGATHKERQSSLSFDNC